MPSILEALQSATKHLPGGYQRHSPPAVSRLPPRNDFGRLLLEELKPSEGMKLVDLGFIAPRSASQSFSCESFHEACCWRLLLVSIREMEAQGPKLACNSLLRPCPYLSLQHLLEPGAGTATARRLPAVVVQVDPHTGLSAVSQVLVGSEPMIRSWISREFGAGVSGESPAPGVGHMGDSLGGSRELGVEAGCGVDGRGWCRKAESLPASKPRPRLLEQHRQPAPFGEVRLRTGPEITALHSKQAFHNP